MADVTPSGPRYDFEMVGLFTAVQGLDGAIGDLTQAGWDRSEMSLLGNKAYLSPTHTTRELADDVNVDRAPVTTDTDTRQAGTLAGGIGGVVGAFLASGATIMSGGTALAAVLGAAVMGAGGAAGGDLLGRMLSRQVSKPVEEQLANGGIVLWVLLRSRDEEAQVRAILERRGATDVHLHAREGIAG